MGFSNSTSTTSFSNYIAPLYTLDLSLATCGSIWYREVKDQQSLSQIQTEVNTYLNPKVYFLPSKVFVVTYDQICDLKGLISIFQIIIASDDLDQHYFFMNFAAISTPGLNGYGYENPNNNSLVDYSLSDPVYSSNVNLPGKWIYISKPDYTPSKFL